MVCAYLYQNIYAYITYKYITHILTHILCINMRTIRIFDHVYSSSHIFTEGFSLEHKRPLCCHVTLSVSPCCCTQYESKHAMYMQVLVLAPAYRILITTGMQGRQKAWQQALRCVRPCVRLCDGARQLPVTPTADEHGNRNSDSAASVYPG